MTNPGLRGAGSWVRNTSGRVCHRPSRSSRSCSASASACEGLPAPSTSARKPVLLSRTVPSTGSGPRGRKRDRTARPWRRRLDRHARRRCARFPTRTDIDHAGLGCACRGRCCWTHDAQCRPLGRATTAAEQASSGLAQEQPAINQDYKPNREHKATDDSEPIYGDAHLLVPLPRSR